MNVNVNLRSAISLRKTFHTPVQTVRRIHAVFLLDPTIRGELESRGKVIRGFGGRKSTSGVQGQSPRWGLGAKPPPKRGSGVPPPEAEQV